MHRSGEPYTGIFIDGRVFVDPVPLKANEPEFSPSIGEKRPLRASFLTFNRIANRYELRRTSCFRNYCPRPDHL